MSISRIGGSPCASSAGTGTPPPACEDDGYQSASLVGGTPSDAEEQSGTEVDWDPYGIPLQPAPNETEPDGAEGDQSLVPPSPSNLVWASFSSPGPLAAELVRGAVSGVIPKGMEALLKQVKHYASSDAFCRRQGLFPLPVDFSIKGTGPESGPSRDFEVHAWTQLICLALNKLAGWSGPIPRQRKGRQSSRAVKGIEDRVRRFLNLFHDVSEDPLKVWDDLKRKRISYDGEEFTEAVAISKNQIMKSLPPQGHGGSVELVPLLVGHTRYLLQNPYANLLDETQKEPGPNTAKVHIAAGEEMAVWKLLHEQGIVDLTKA